MKTGIVLSAALVLALARPAGAQQEVSQRARMPATGAVEIHNAAGTVRVSAWNRAEVQVTGTLGRGAERLQLGPEGSRMVVRVVVPRGARNVRGSDIEVRVPARSALSVRASSADVEVGGVTGAVAVNTSSGNVTVDGRPAEVAVATRSGQVTLDVQTRRLKAESTSGDVTVEGSVRELAQLTSLSGDLELLATAGEVKAEASSGNVRVRSVAGRAEVSTVSGDVEVEGRRIRGSFQTVTGDITVRGDLDRGATTTLASHSGDVELALPRGASAELEVTSHSGDIYNEIENARVQRQGTRPEYRIRVGNGGARVVVRTFNGDVKLTGQ